MTKLQTALDYMRSVPFPQMELGAAGAIVADGRIIATMNLKDLTLTEAFTFASAFIAAGDALAVIEGFGPQPPEVTP